MKITALRLFNVKRFAARGVAIEGIGDGVNVLCAANEFGKSTSFEALHALFFQPHSGKAGDVQKLRPYSGGNPLIEADIVTPQGRYRIAKQYFGRSSASVCDLDTGRILAQADDAENFIAGLVKGGTSGPAGLLWVRQGLTGIEKRSKPEEENEKQVRASLLESVQGEVEAITGGRRMAEIIAATEEALGELVTATGRPKTGGRYAAAISLRDQLLTQEQKFAAEVSALRDALDRRAGTLKRLVELDSSQDREERRHALATAQAAFEAARARVEKLKTAETSLTLARERRAAAERDLAAMNAALARSAELRARSGEAERQRGAALVNRRDAAEAIAKARTEVEAAEAEEQANADLLARLDSAMKAREARERLAGLKERLREAETARKAFEESEARLAVLMLPAKAVEELEALELELIKLRAIEETTRPTVAIRYEAGAAGLIQMDGVPLDEGEARSYDEQAQIVIAGIGTLSLRSNRPPRSDDRLARTQEARRTLLARMGIPDLSTARARQVEAQQVEAELRELRGRLALLAPEGLPKLREAVAEHTGTEADPLEVKADPATVGAALEAARKRRAAARLALREVEPLHAGSGDAVIAAETLLAKLQAEEIEIEARLGPAETREARKATLSASFAAHESTVAQAEAIAERLRMEAGDLESAEAALRRATSVHEAAEKEIALLRETIAGLNAEIRARAEEAVEEKWREITEALAAAQARVTAFEKEVAVLQRLGSALKAARSTARELYLQPVMTELKPLLGLLFDDVSITFDEEALVPKEIRRNGQDEDVARLSGGMREQLSVLTRLAFARLLARDGRPAPVILDDALVYSDDDRIEKMFDALHRQSKDQQIIVFSCRQRAFQKLGGNVLRMTEWVP